MKSRWLLTLAVLALAVLLSLTGQPAAARLSLEDSKIPSYVISYQGTIRVDGVPYTGTGYFKFAIVDSDGTTTYWSNDGTSANGQEPVAAVPLAVTDGLFSVLLGDAPMVYLTPAIFDHLNLALRVWFSEDATGFDLLDPDRRLAHVPYALHAEEAHNADLLDNQDGSFYQRRVNGTCAAGSTVKEIASDGTVTCLEVEPRPGFTVSNIAPNAQYTSITIGSDGLGLIASGPGLNIIHCDNPACTTGMLTSLSAHGEEFSITIGADGLGLISYYDATAMSLKVAHCSNIACTAATISPLDSTGSAGRYTSITIGADGLGLISYAEDPPGDLKVAHCNNPTCTTAAISSLNSGDDGVMWTSITITREGRGLISYYDDYNAGLKAAYCDNAACTTATYSKVDVGVENVGQSNSITTGADGLGLIAYYSSNGAHLKVAHCEDAGCTTSSSFTIDDTITAMPSITIGADGLGLISYRDDEGANQDLMIAHCRNTECNSADLSVVDSVGDVGWFSSITIGTDGMALISYRDVTNNRLKVAHLSNSFGIPYWRRR